MKKEKDEFNLTEVISSSKEKLKEGLANAVLEELKNSLSYQMSDFIGKIVDEFMNEHIKPEIGKKLLKNRLGIIEELEKGIEEIGEELARKMKEVAFKNIADMGSYAFEELMKRIF